MQLMQHIPVSHFSHLCLSVYFVNRLLQIQYPALAMPYQRDKLYIIAYSSSKFNENLCPENSLLKEMYYVTMNVNQSIQMERGNKK